MSGIVEIEVTDVSVEGWGIGRHEGKVVFIEQALPGDRVLARITESRRGFDRAEVHHILAESKDRRIPACEIQGRCGGCPLMPLNEEAALRIKVRHLEEVLRRVGRLDLAVHRVIRSPQDLAYRNRVRFALESTESGVRIGFRRRGEARHFVEVSRCRLLPERGTRLARDLASRLPRAARVDALTVRHAREGRCWLLVLHGAASPCAALSRAASSFLGAHEDVIGVTHHEERAREVVEATVLAGRGVIEERIGSISVPVSSSVFLQVNTKAAERLYGEVRSMIAGEEAPKTVLDLYCGLGMIGLFCCAPQTSVLGVESHLESVEIGRAMIRAQARRGFELVAAKAADFVEEVIGEQRPADSDRRFDVIVMNPPRAGAGRALVEKIVRLSPRRIVMVSCHDAAMARDLQVLAEHGYDVTRMSAVDLFPQTTHLEIVALVEPQQTR